MKKFKRIAAGVLAAATMAATGVTAFADTKPWNINYTYGAPSSVSNQMERITYDNFAGRYVIISCNSINTGGKVEVLTSDFSPTISATFERTGSLSLNNPISKNITIEFWARTSRVVAGGDAVT